MEAAGCGCDDLLFGNAISENGSHGFRGANVLCASRPLLPASPYVCSFSCRLTLCLQQYTAVGPPIYLHYTVSPTASISSYYWLLVASMRATPPSCIFENPWFIDLTAKVE